MKLGLITDAHGNLEALRAVIHAISAEACDIVVHLGDAVGQGLYSQECLDLLAERGIVMLRGNYENLFGGHATLLPDDLDDWEKGARVWTRERLSQTHVELMAKQPLALDLKDSAFTVHCCHYAMDAVAGTFKSIERNLNVLVLESLFSGVRADCVVFGHDHAGCQYSDIGLYLNPGSVGLRRGRVVNYCTVTIGRNMDYAVKAVSYDLDRYLQDLQHSDFPGRAFTSCVLTMPRYTPLEEMVRMISQAIGKRT